MKNRGLIKNFMLIMLALSASIMLLWAVFYVLTVEIARRNMIQMAENASGSILESVEKELLRIEDTAYNLAHYDRVMAMAETKDIVSFYELGAVAKERGDLIISNAAVADHVVVFRKDGAFYRLKGGISNTALKRAFQLIDQKAADIVTVMYNNNMYIGTCKSIPAENGDAGYVALFMDNVFIENLLSAYRDIDYLGIALISDEKMIASNKEIGYSDVDKIKEKSVFYKEKEIGFTGFRLFVYCENSVSGQLSAYFTVTFSAMVAVLILLIIVFVRYLMRHILKPMNHVIAETREGGIKPLPHTGEEAFDGLVDHLNDMVIRIEEREKELYSSEVKRKEAEVEKERTLINLLKKQISAHFTVNTLNAVRALVNKGERKAAAKICDELSTLLRYANAGDEFISLMDEFYVLEQYMRIMQIRYPGKIEAQFDEDDSFADYFIPRMLIQPVLENAIVHGLDGMPGKVEVSAVVAEREVCVSVKDNGKGMDPEQLMMVRESLEGTFTPELADLDHVALNNVQKRIRMVCGDQYGVEIDSRPGEGCEVKLHFPKKIAPE